MRRQNQIVRSFFCLALLGAPIVGCSDDDTDDDKGSNDSGTVSDAGFDGSVRNDGGMDASIDSGPARDAGGGSDAAAVALTEAQVVGVATALNTGEIQAGTLAQTKTTADSDARDYAAMMVTMHTAAQARQTALGITPASSPVQTEVTAMATAALQALQNVPTGAAFDRAYIQSQVVMHTSARDLIDSALLPNATTSALRAELTRARGEVVTHLDQAVSILAALSDGGVSGPDGGADASTDSGTDAGGDAGGDAGT